MNLKTRIEQMVQEREAELMDMRARHRALDEKIDALEGYLDELRVLQVAVDAPEKPVKKPTGNRKPRTGN